jgi:hypothetical protein
MGSGLLDLLHHAGLGEHRSKHGIPANPQKDRKGIYHSYEIWKNIKINCIYTKLIYTYIFVGLLYNVPRGKCANKCGNWVQFSETVFNQVINKGNTYL